MTQNNDGLDPSQGLRNVVDQDFRRPSMICINVSNADIIWDIDQVLIMSVDPGFGGQAFIEHTYQKIECTRDLIMKSGSKARIELDGGVNLSNALRCMEFGADVLVAGSSVFGSSNPIETIAALKAL